MSALYSTTKSRSCRSIPAASAASSACSATVDGGVSAPVSAATAAAAAVLPVRVSLPALAVPSVLVLAIVTAAVRCPGLVFEMSLAAAAAESIFCLYVSPRLPKRLPRLSLSLSSLCMAVGGFDILPRLKGGGVISIVLSKYSICFT